VATEPYILIVDDFPDGREMLAEYLAFRGMAAVTSCDGEEALEVARKRPPAVVLMDLTMPGMGGWEATRQLKADPVTRDAIVIALTAHALAPDEGMARQAGCDGFVAKPYDLAELGNALERLLSSGRPALKTLPMVVRPTSSHTRRG
jgi:two-component system, cell cycle response regulator DivK